jgi:hypothetical protein
MGGGAGKCHSCLPMLRMPVVPAGSSGPVGSSATVNGSSPPADDHEEKPPQNSSQSSWYCKVRQGISNAVALHLTHTPAGALGALTRAVPCAESGRGERICSRGRWAVGARHIVAAPSRRGRLPSELRLAAGCSARKQWQPSAATARRAVSGARRLQLPPFAAFLQRAEADASRKTPSSLT